MANFLDKSINFFSKLNRRSRSDTISFDNMNRGMTRSAKVQKYINKSPEDSLNYQRIKEKLNNTISSSANFKLVRESSNGTFEEVNNPIVETLLENPFSNYTWNDFVKQFASQVQEYGMCLIYLGNDQTRERAKAELEKLEIDKNFKQQLNTSSHILQIIDGSNIQDVEFQSGVAQKVNLTGINGLNNLVIGENCVIHVSARLQKGWNQERITPQRTINLIQTNIDIERNLREAVLSATLNPQRSGGLYNIDKDLAYENAIKVTEAIKQNQGSIENQGEDLVAQGVSYSQTSNADIPQGLIDYSNKIFEEQLLAFGETALSFGQVPSGVAFSTLRLLQSLYYTNTVKPYLDDIAELFSVSILPIVTGNCETKMMFDDPTPIDMQDEEQRARELYNSELINLNEARQRIGLDEVPEGQRFRNDINLGEGINNI